VVLVSIPYIYSTTKTKAKIMELHLDNFIENLPASIGVKSEEECFTEVITCIKAGEYEFDINIAVCLSTDKHTGSHDIPPTSRTRIEEIEIAWIQIWLDGEAVEVTDFQQAVIELALQSKFELC
jgi:hypothetical protein